MRRFIAGLVLLFLAGCGGGGGGGNVAGGSSGGGGGAESAISFTPQNLNVSYDEHTSPSVTFVANVNANLAGTVYVAIADPQHLLESASFSVNDQPPNSLTATVRPNSQLDFGTYDGSFQVHFCKVADCSTEYPGSPVALPYHFVIARHDPGVGLFAQQGNLIVTDFLPNQARAITLQMSAPWWPQAGLYLRVSDGAGYIASTIPVAAKSSGGYQDVSIPLNLPGAGHYPGTLTATVCRDAACAMTVANYTFRYDFYVESTELVDAAANATPVLSSLQPLPGASDWSGTGGDTGHSGYVPGTFDTSRFSLRWRWPLPLGKAYQLTQPSVAAGRVAVAAAGVGGSADTALFVLNESDGSLNWSLPGTFPAQQYFSAPSLSDTTLFSVVSSFSPALRAYDAATGAQRFSTSLSQQTGGASELPPTLASDAVLMSGRQGGAASIGTVDGVVRWVDPLGSESWIPSARNGVVYQFSAGQLWLLDAASGQNLGVIQDSEWKGWVGGPPISQTTVLGEAGFAFVVDRGNLMAFDTVSRKVAWRLTSGDVVNGTAAQGGTVIALRQGPLRVEAHRQSDGALLWSYRPYFDVFTTETGPANFLFISDPVLTDNLVFVSTDLGVYAIDRQNGTPRWFYGHHPSGRVVPTYRTVGGLAISKNGVLLISDGLPPGVGGVTAINLR